MRHTGISPSINKRHIIQEDSASLSSVAPRKNAVTGWHTAGGICKETAMIYFNESQAATAILYEGLPTCKRLRQFGKVQAINDTRWTEAINKCGLYQLQTLRGRHVTTNRQASSVWFYLSGDPHKKIDRRRSARRCYVDNFQQHIFSPHSPSHGLWSCLFGFTSPALSRPTGLYLNSYLHCLYHFPFCCDFLTVIILSVYVSQPHTRDRTVYVTRVQNSKYLSSLSLVQKMKMVFVTLKSLSRAC